jgi:flagellar hook-associated protein 2
MTSPITFSGLGSGIDIDAIVTGLISADSVPKNQALSRVVASKAAISDLSSVGSLLSSLKSVVDSMDTASELSAYTGSSANESALTVSASGLARAGSYDVQVKSLVQEQRSYSTTFDEKSTALSKTGTLRLTQGGQDFDVDVVATDTLENIAAKINASGAKIRASAFYDGSQYRLQLSGSEGGADNAFTMTDLSSSLGMDFDAGGPPKQLAADAEIVIDGFSVFSKSNVVSGAIEGVTLNLKDKTTGTFKVQVASDPQKLTDSLKDFVSKYNSVISKIHLLAGFGSVKGTSSELAGDSALRGIANGLSSKVIRTAGTGGSLDSLADIGVRLNNDGTLRLDETKLKDALEKNPEDFKKVLAGDGTTDGLMDMMSDMLKGFAEAKRGLIPARTDALNARIKLYQETADREQARLDRMETRLRKMFNDMDTAVAASNNQLNYIYQMG